MTVSSDLQALLDHAPGGVSYWHADLTNGYVNRAYGEAFGASAEGIRGQRMEDVLGAPFVDRHRASLEAVRGRARRTFEIGMPTPDGADASYEVDCVPDTREGCEGAFFMFVRDNTPRQRAEAEPESSVPAPRTSEQRFKTVVANVPALVGYWGTDGRMLFGNRVYTEWFGIPVDSLPGRTAEEVLGEDLYAKTRMNLRAALSGMSQRFERTFKDVRGEWRRAEVSYVPDIIDGTQHGMFVFAYDVTELSRRVEQRTAELRVAMEAAEAANRVKDEIIRNVSHEMRTPLHGIVGFASLGVNKLTPDSVERCRSYFERILSSGRRLTHFVDQILILARLKSGELMPNPKSTDLVTLVIRVVADMQSLFDEKRVTVRTSAAHGPMSAEIDIVLFERVVLNLLSNATKFSPPNGTITVTVATTTMAGLGDMDAPAVSIRVEDQGPGIPPDEIDLIFEPFIQGSQAQGYPGGTGLGLAISRRIVDLHGGRLSASNIPDRGARFDVTVPVKATPLPITFPSITPLAG